MGGVCALSRFSLAHEVNLLTIRGVFLSCLVISESLAVPSMNRQSEFLAAHIMLSTKFITSAELMDELLSLLDVPDVRAHELRNDIPQ